MGFSIHIDNISIGLPIVYFKGLQIEFSVLCISVLEGLVVLILANSADPDEMQLPDECSIMPKYLFRVSSILFTGQISIQDYLCMENLT